MNTESGVSILTRAKQIFLLPKPEYSFREIVHGVIVEGPMGRSRRMMAVASNSFIKQPVSR